MRFDPKTGHTLTAGVIGTWLKLDTDRVIYLEEGAENGTTITEVRVRIRNGVTLATKDEATITLMASGPVSGG